MGLFGKKKDEFIKIKVENLIDWKEPNGEGCIVSDKITKEGYKVGYMYREQPDEGRPDSGWRFMAGNEDDEYMNNPIIIIFLLSIQFVIMIKTLFLICIQKLEVLI